MDWGVRVIGDLDEEGIGVQHRVDEGGVSGSVWLLWLWDEYGGFCGGTSRLDWYPFDRPRRDSVILVN